MKVLRLVGVRLVSVVPVAFGVLALTFFLSRIVAGDPIALFVPENAPDSQRQELREKFNLDKPVGEQFVLYLEDAVRGDLGESVFTGQPVSEDMLQRLPATIELGAVALVIAIGGGVVLGIVSAIVKTGPISLATRGITLFGISVPGFWLGLVVLYLMFFVLGLFPGPVGRYTIGGETPDGPTGLFLVDSLLAGDFEGFRTSLHHVALPAATLGFVSLAPIARITRSAMLDVMSSEYIRAARAMAIPPSTIYFRYALKNALLPVITIIGGTVGFMFAGTVLVESVFNWPGVGLYALGAVQRADFPALQGFVIWAAIAYVLAYLLVDLLYFAADPRIR